METTRAASEAPLKSSGPCKMSTQPGKKVACNICNVTQRPAGSRSSENPREPKREPKSEVISIRFGYRTLHPDAGLSREALGTLGTLGGHACRDRT